MPVKTDKQPFDRASRNKPRDLKSKVREHAKSTIGFDDCRFTDPRADKSLGYYRDWLSNGLHGEMDYLKRHLKFKENPDLLLKGVRSAIVVIKNYKNTTAQQLEGDLKVARYAAGEDYHLIMRDKLNELEGFLKSQSSARTYSGVDSRPLSERSLALKAGVGFLGKNSMVIRPGLGSYFFIGVILTTVKFEPDPRLEWDCGRCRLCIDACPTNAISENHSVNATQCISYMTIEQKQPLSQIQQSQRSGWIFGCDICQEVCPYNHERTPITDWTPFSPELGIGLDLSRVSPENVAIPKHSAAYRSRQRLVPNLQNAQEILNQSDTD